MLRSRLLRAKKIRRCITLTAKCGSQENTRGAFPRQFGCHQQDGTFANCEEDAKGRSSSHPFQLMSSSQVPYQARSSHQSDVHSEFTSINHTSELDGFSDIIHGYDSSRGNSCEGFRRQWESHWPWKCVWWAIRLQLSGPILIYLLPPGFVADTAMYRTKSLYTYPS